MSDQPKHFHIEEVCERESRLQLGRERIVGEQ